MVRSSVENGIKVVRVACCDAVKTIQVRKKPIDEFVATGIEHSQCKFNPTIVKSVHGTPGTLMTDDNEIDWFFFCPR